MGKRSDGFTLLELVIVIAIIGSILSTFIFRSSLLGGFRSRQSIDEMVKTIEFLHHYSKHYSTFFRLEIDLEKTAWRVGQVSSSIDHQNTEELESLSDAFKSSTDGENNTGFKFRRDSSRKSQPRDIDYSATGLGSLTIELNQILNPVLGDPTTHVAPKRIPSLGEWHEIDQSYKITDVITPRGKITEDSGINPYILFSPKGFTEFAVIHVEKGEDEIKTMVINSFAGYVDIHDGYKEFEWSIPDSSGGI